MIEARLLAEQGILVVTPKSALSAEDFVGIAAIVDPYLDEHGELAGLLIQAKDFPGWEDFSSLISHLRFVNDHHKKVARVAAVSDSRFLKIAPLVAKHFVSAEVRHFPYDEYDSALAWLGGNEGVPMTTSERSAELAAGWIEAWTRMDMDWLRQWLAPDFVHVSPFGRLEGRDAYLAAVEPMARKSVVALRIRGVVATADQAAVRFENRTQRGVVETCDWLRIEDDRIQEIRSFYDSATIRELLSPTDQESLGGSS